jgi:hypothetical protein
VGDITERRSRLEEVLFVAQAYRGWSRKQLAHALGRDPSNLVPPSGLPKVDLVAELARVLDWSIEKVVSSFLDVDLPPGPDGAEAEVPDEFDALEAASKRAASEARHRPAVRLARRAYALARDDEQRAIACTRESCGWDGLGRYDKAMEASKRGLAGAAPRARRRQMQANLASEYYTLGGHLESRSLAGDLIGQFGVAPPRSRIDRVTAALASYVRGNSSRQLMMIHPDSAEELARRTVDDLQRARDAYLALADDFDCESYRGVAHTCEGGILEAEVQLGRHAPEDALAAFSARLEALTDPGDCHDADWLESYGWWCIYGSNVAMRHLNGQRDVQQAIAVFTNKADEIAERTNNWAMRERVITLDFCRRVRLAEWVDMETDWSIDNEDVRVIAGTMGRFPAFHKVGWEILRRARIVEGGS